jgi:hypothetical protein
MLALLVVSSKEVQLPKSYLDKSVSARIQEEEKVVKLHQLLFRPT